MSNVLVIIRQHLECGAYDGLYLDGVCACRRDDLAPCGCINEECRAGIFIGPNLCDQCAGGDPCGFHIGPRPEAPE